MEIDLANLVKVSIPVQEGFRKVETRQWDLEAVFLELETEIGYLGRPITIFEGNRHGRKSRHQMADELSDILFVLIRIAQDFDIELPPWLTISVLSSPITAFFDLIRKAEELREAANRNEKETIRRLLLRMFSLVGGIAFFYGLSLEEAHLEEMRLASRWQRLFFFSRWPRFLRMVIWKITITRHERKLDRL